MKNIRMPDADVVELILAALLLFLVAMGIIAPRMVRINRELRKISGGSGYGKRSGTATF